jgi:aromatic ring-cleaving dioxygenase
MENLMGKKRRVNNIWPPVRLDFMMAVDRRAEPRDKPVYDVYFRDASSGTRAAVAWITEKFREKRN